MVAVEKREKLREGREGMSRERVLRIPVRVVFKII
jgi:hypothetical protein